MGSSKYNPFLVLTTNEVAAIGLRVSGADAVGTGFIKMTCGGQSYARLAEWLPMLSLHQFASLLGLTTTASLCLVEQANLSANQ